MSLQDERLVIRVCEGDMNAFAELTTKYSNAVYAAAFSVVGDFHIAQDIAQESFVKAWYKIHTLEQKEGFGSWLYTITKRMSMDWIRKREIPPGGHLMNDLIDPISLEERIDNLERKRAVWSALNTLDEKYRTVIAMYFISGFSV
ncbi:RNA polymerase sigma-70 factor (ECF subfamily) [Paenibacillus cellulosilyticus]|uniref:RNA polymerase sigma factor n=1 Tax=Paenibacillus cellulosilyticus TaxID=375489 RepID=A0A2V2Z3D2_9BACL|nr:sigma-70 family RNA polymerase sigma factor [Paenibacillus cellulosilyticus]PWW08776.1 RNA polymerase sigma-70 factor (ECF subfamily) [Paenibacillus cellulosilyticus]QKS48331.1 sigma-70 family RNA polymerase sigma factor [Paenibacillus cellulosilyticus]